MSAGGATVRAGAALHRLEALVARIRKALTATGAVMVDPPALQPAAAMLDLYGEDIRARAYVTRDDHGERMLRPDFTVPIVRLHMAEGAVPARYAYAGPVWRRQAAGSARAREFWQAGIELFDPGDPARADAEVFGLIRDALEDAPVTPVTGDLGLILAAIEGLDTTADRRAALRRHLWRPQRFRRLLDRYGAGHGAASAARADLIATRDAGRLAGHIAAAGPAIGVRTAADVAARVDRLAAEAATPPLSSEQVGLLEAVMGLKGTSAAVLSALDALARALPGLAPARERLVRRLEALAAIGIDPDTLAFEGSFGLTTLEYYDGFVFGFVPQGGGDGPPVASGGRYDMLTRLLGGGDGIPAVGAIIRPETLIALEAG